VLIPEPISVTKERKNFDSHHLESYAPPTVMGGEKPKPQQIYKVLWRRGRKECCHDKIPNIII
jgi:hypothetical protein